MLNSNATNESLCPVCGKFHVQEFDICPICGWENDLNQLWKPDFSGGANEMSLNEARRAFQSGQPIK